MSDYTYYECPCGRNHPVGVECAIGKAARLKSSRRWVAGQIWKTKHGFLMRVESVRADGVALITMMEPYKTRAYTQRLIPSGWVKQPTTEP